MTNDARTDIAGRVVDEATVDAALGPRSEFGKARERCDARADAQARDSEAGTAADTVLWEGDGAFAAEHNRIVDAHGGVLLIERRNTHGEWITCNGESYRAKSIAAHLARRLIAVEAENKAQVERAWRQAWNAGRLSHAGNPAFSSQLELNDALDHDWQQSRARAELERAK